MVIIIPGGKIAILVSSWYLFHVKYLEFIKMKWIENTLKLFNTFQLKITNIIFSVTWNTKIVVFIFNVIKYISTKTNNQINENKSLFLKIYI